MTLNNKSFDYTFLLAPRWNSWTKTVINQDVGLTEFENGKLDVALQYPDLFEESTYAYLLYKILRRSPIEEARGFAERLSRNVGRFGRFEDCLQARESAFARQGVEFPKPMAVPIFSILNHLGNVRPLFRPPVLRPAPLMAGIGLVL